MCLSVRKNESASYAYVRARLRTTQMARGKKVARTAQKRQCNDDANACTSKEQAARASKPKHARKLVGARELTKQLFRKERARTHQRLAKECAAKACASDDEVSAVDASPGAAVHAVFGAREHDEYVDVSVQDDDGWQQRPSRMRVYDACAWTDECLENVCETRASSESDASNVQTLLESLAD